MKSIFIASINARSGKTVITLGIALNSKVYTGFFKPFQEKMITVNGHQIEEDAYLMQSLVDFEANPNELCPFPREKLPNITMDQIVDAYKKVSKDKELMIIEGMEYITTGFLYGISAYDIVETLKSDLILLTDSRPESLDRVAMIKNYLDYRNIPLKGVILNLCNDVGLENFLIGKGIPVIGSMPYTPSLRTLHVFEIVEELNGIVLTGNDNLNNLVEKTLIGAMSKESALKYFERVPNKAVITGGDRSDILMTALNTSTSCIILTGGLLPSQEVINRARFLGVPMISVKEDTLSASEAVDNMIARIDPTDEKKIKTIKEEVARNVDLSRIWG
ncbi:phosphotransacetylase [Methanocella sp. CWC-04]|uniref:Phosphotransacetylase n=1 Tax=Methanooceanicella nereidis TaxID=2052831 RepID=A0AAP2RG66_9EURY|nr:AAA family ATPase [Methanocella sp. CWC-04]MCD1295652.1 phosphotransacetylase [Methanocella sp. CWC-04]